MPRVNRVGKAKKNQGECGKCGIEIAPGDSYVWWKFRYGGKRIRCGSSQCYPKRGELTQSPYYQAMYSIEDELYRVCDADSIEEAADIVRECADRVRQDLAEPYLESAENIEAGFGHPTEMSERLQENSVAMEEWAEAIESCADEIEGIFFVEPFEPEEPGPEPERSEFDSEEEYEEALSEYEDAYADYEEAMSEYENEYESAMADWRQDVEDKAEEAIAANPGVE